jgi:hypothetical protein
MSYSLFSFRVSFSLSVESCLGALTIRISSWLFIDLSYQGYSINFSERQLFKGIIGQKSLRRFKAVFTVIDLAHMQAI